MSEVEGIYYLKRMFLGVAGAIGILVALYVFRAVRLYLFGTRVSAIVRRVMRKFTAGSRQAAYVYVVEYHDAESGTTRTACDAQGLPLQEYERGARVIAFIDRRRGVAEILSWRRLLFSAGIIALVVLTLAIAYHFMVGAKELK